MRLEPQQHQLMLALKGLPAGCTQPLETLAERMQIQHHSTVELVNRLSAGGLVRRSRTGEDRRQVLLGLTPKGESVLRELSMGHKAELRTHGPALVAALERAMRPTKGAQRVRAKGCSGRFGKGRLDVSNRADRIPDGAEPHRSDSRPRARRSATQLWPSPPNSAWCWSHFSRPAIGLIAGGIAFLLYKLIGLLTNMFFLRPLRCRLHQRSPQSSWAVGHPDSGDRRTHRRSHGQVRVIEDQGTRHSRGHGGGALQSQPYSAAGGNSETHLGGHRDWYRRSLRRRRPNYSNRRRRRDRWLDRSFTPRRRSAKYCWPAERRPACRQLSIRRSPA